MGFSDSGPNATDGRASETPRIRSRLPPLANRLPPLPFRPTAPCVGHFKSGRRGQPSGIRGGFWCHRRGPSQPRRRLESWRGRMGGVGQKGAGGENTEASGGCGSAKREAGVYARAQPEPSQSAPTLQCRLAMMMMMPGINPWVFRLAGIS